MAWYKVIESIYKIRVKANQLTGGERTEIYLRGSGTTTYTPDKMVLHLDDDGVDALYDALERIKESDDDEELDVDWWHDDADGMKPERVEIS